VSELAGVSGADPAANYPLNCWYVAADSAEIGAGLLARTLLGRPVVLYRQRSGAIAALDDRCPHRSFPLSQGTVSDDQVVCGYHGMTFAADGRCVRVPSQQNVPYDARVTSFPVREEKPFVWLWLGDPGRAAFADPPALPWLQDERWTTFGETFQVEANYMLLHENALDLTHFPYVHPESSPVGYLKTPPQLQIEVSETSVSYHRDFPPGRLVGWQAETTGLSSDREYAQRESGIFVSPALHVDRMHVFPDGNGSGRYDKILTRAFTPLSTDRTAVFWQVSRNYLTDRPEVSEQLRAVHRRTLHADKRVLEAIQARVGTGPQRAEFNVTADLAALRAHRIVAEMLEQERGHRYLPAGTRLRA